MISVRKKMKYYWYKKHKNISIKSNDKGTSNLKQKKKFNEST